MSNERLNTCIACGRALENSIVARAEIPAVPVLLWDNRTYCATCVRTMSPLLLDAALANDSFAEKGPSFRDAAIALAFVTVLLFGVVVAAFLFLLDVPYMASIVVVAIALAIAIFQSLITFGLSLQNRATVKVRNGTFEVTRRNGRWRYVVPLQTCTWSIGSPQQDFLQLFTAGAAAKQVVILMEYPYRLANFWPVRYRVPCGWTPQAFEIWQAFLHLAEVPPSRNRLRRPL